MACEVIAKGRKLACKDNRVGIKMVDFALWDSTGFTVTAQEVASLPSWLTDVYRYEVKATGNNLVETPTTDMEKRTIDIKQVLNLVLQKMSKESEVELLAMIYSTLVAFVHDYNGNVHVVGIYTGLDSTTATKSTDDGGYKITLEATDTKFSPYLSGSAKTALEALVSVDNVTP